MDQDHGRRATQVIAIGNQKGGVAKTTNAVAVAVLRRKYRARFADLYESLTREIVARVENLQTEPS